MYGARARCCRIYFWQLKVLTLSSGRSCQMFVLFVFACLRQIIIIVGARQFVYSIVKLGTISTFPWCVCVRATSSHAEETVLLQMYLFNFSTRICFECKNRASIFRTPRAPHHILFTISGIFYFKSYVCDWADVGWWVSVCVCVPIPQNRALGVCILSASVDLLAQESCTPFKFSLFYIFAISSLAFADFHLL